MLNFLRKHLAKPHPRRVLYAYVNKTLKVGEQVTKHVIELNGQKYDARTGKPVTHMAVATAQPIPKQPSGPRHLDGFSRRPGVPKLVHAKMQKSQTLMRQVVAKPTAPVKIHAKTAAPVAYSTPASTQPKIETIKPGRAIRATHATQSSLISKFGKTPVTIDAAVVPVKPAPEPSNPVAHISKPVVVPPTPKTSTKNAVFQKAIEQAVSHEAPKLKKPRVHHRVAKKLHVSPRLVTFASMTLLVLAVGTFFAYQNMPEIAMKVASARAGLKANLPAYQPSGFSLAGPIKYDSGEVTLNYKSNSDQRAFNVVQKNSSWNSETLLENFVASTKQPYQTFQANGRTIYIYDGNKATWVDGGVWFNIDGQANLNSDQLLKIADSL
jgi:hypothetical protein